MRAAAQQGQEARRAVAPHRVERVREPEQQRAGAARDDEPEERAEDRVVAVLERRFDGRARQRPFVRLARVARHDARGQRARRVEVAPQQRGGDRRDVLGEALRTEREPQQRDVQRSGERPGQHGDEPCRDGHRRHDRREPRGDADHAAAPARVQRGFDACGQATERDERMPAGRLADGAVDDRGRDREHRDDGQRQHQHDGAPALRSSGSPATSSVTRVASAATRWFRRPSSST